MGKYDYYVCLKPFNSQDLIRNSPYCLSYNFCDVCLENLELDQPIIVLYYHYLSA